MGCTSDNHNYMCQHVCKRFKSWEIQALTKQGKSKLSGL